MRKIACVLLSVLLLWLPSLAFASAQGARSIVAVVDPATGNDDDVYVQELFTDEKLLMDALVALDFIKVEKVSWGFNVVEVNGVAADFEKDGTYWTILEYDAEEETFLRMETPIEKVELSEEFIVGFILER